MTLKLKYLAFPLLFLHVGGCLSPVRPEPPTPSPVADAFVGLSVDCRDAEVVDELSSALAPTSSCLERVDAYECLVWASRLLMKSTIACAVARNGTDASLLLEKGDDSRRNVAQMATGAKVALDELLSRLDGQFDVVQKAFQLVLTKRRRT